MMGGNCGSQLRMVETSITAGFRVLESDSWQRNPHRNGLMPFRAEFESTSNRTCNLQLGYGFSWGTESQTRTRTLGNPCAKPARVALLVPCPSHSAVVVEGYNLPLDVGGRWDIDLSAEVEYSIHF